MNFINFKYRNKALYNVNINIEKYNNNIVSIEDLEVIITINFVKYNFRLPLNSEIMKNIIFNFT